MDKFWDTPIPDDLVFVNAPNCRTRREASTSYPLSSTINEKQPLHNQGGETIIYEHRDPFSLSDIVDRQVTIQRNGLIRKSVRSGKCDLEAEKRRLELIGGRTTIPVPQAVQCSSSGEFEHLVMERLPGKTLESVWGHLSTKERESIADQVADFVTQLHQLKNDTIDAQVFVRQELSSGLNNSTSFSLQRIKNYSGMEVITRFVRDRSQMLDDQQNVFTHGDLDWSNILIADKNVCGIIDLECSGFLPPYCEWIAVKRLSDRHPWFGLLEPRLKSAKWDLMWEVEELISALSNHSQWALVPIDRATNQTEGWAHVPKIVVACVGDGPLVTYELRSKHPLWQEYKANKDKEGDGIIVEQLKETEAPRNSDHGS
ncbi:protein kinase-like domain [Pochonia chlamydosporia 170]|uniref:Protein kinase-like domain n=1 Tax=Pochonia chlamydosporia 170 TaxID=1380566 RepID=A0A179FDY9_METCM|nr:protein kinase-like domain [Pochonia chlamydosporia 170]OAQ63696.1 protein kinase-like domain [Pochonia chlamydosporia 170]